MYKKKILKNNVILMSLLFLTALVVMQTKAMKDKYIYTGLQSVAAMGEDVAIQSQELNKMILLKEKKYEELQDFKTKYANGNQTAVLKETLEKRKMQAGYTDLQGEGVVIKLEDSQRELREGENPNDLVIHDQDILILLNDLKVAGAEALSVNGQRIVGNTEIKCTGATIKVNGFTYGQPFIIKAIGNPEQLEAAVLSPNSYGNILQTLYRIQIQVEKKEVKIERFAQ